MPEPSPGTAEPTAEAAPRYTAPAFPQNETLRQQALDKYQLLDTAAEQSYDDLTRLAALICGTPVALLSLVDHGRQWFKSRVGMEAEGTPRDISFCGHAILEPDQIFEVVDATQDPRFAHNPMVESDLNVRFYAGAPLVSPEGFALGALCVMDTTPRALTPQQSEALTCLARQAVAQMELRESVLQLQERSLRAARLTAESMRLQAHLASSEGRFRLLAEASSDIIVLLDLSGTQHYVSPAMARVLGWQPEQVKGRNYLQMAHPDDRASLDHTFAQCRKGRPICPLEYRAQKADGLYTWLEVNLRLYRDADSRTAGGFVAVARDISLRKALEEERQRAYQVMEQANQELEKSRAAALQSTRAKSEFLSNMSHEIRTPMNGVVGMIQLLQATSLSAEQRRYVEIAQNSGQTLLALIDDILDLSKIEAGKLAIESLDFDLKHSLSDIVEMWGLQARAQGLAFHEELAPEIPKNVRGDPHRLRQILNNLLSNAIKFTQQGHVKLHADLVDADGQRVVVYFCVADTGIGLRPDQAAMLFSPFVQADASTTRNYGGTGLGLAICKRLVELMGGEIGVQSGPSTGSTFWFTISFAPAAEGDLTDAAGLQAGHMVADAPSPIPIQTPPQAPQQAPQQPGSAGARILVVEDNHINRLVMRTLLQKLGYQAEVVINGKEAVEATAHRTFDLVLMDCEMPIMDGYEATRRIREAGDVRVPIIAVTAHAMSGDRERCILAGMDDFLSKPVDMKLLAKVLEKWCALDTHK